MLTFKDFGWKGDGLQGDRMRVKRMHHIIQATRTRPAEVLPDTWFCFGPDVHVPDIEAAREQAKKYGYNGIIIG